MRLLITRPQPDADRFAAELAAAGHEALVAPLMRIEVDRTKAPDLAGADAIAVTSANGIRALADLTPDRSVPVFAVGPGSAAAATSLGFPVAGAGGGDVDGLAACIAKALPAGATVYHPAGRDRAGDLAALLAPHGLSCRRQVLYAAQAAAALPEIVVTALRAGRLDGAVFFSPRSARLFVSLMSGAGLGNTCAGLVLFALSAAVRAAAEGGPAWRETRVAALPDQAALIETIRAYAGDDAPEQP